MHIWTILWQSTAIFLVIFLTFRLFRYRYIRRLYIEEMDRRIKAFKIVPVPENEKYVIVRAKELQVNDIIIERGIRFEINQVILGHGAGSFDFGEYVSIQGHFVNGNPTDPYPEKSFWLYRESPTIKCVNE